MKSNTALSIKPTNSASEEKTVLIVEDDADLRQIIQWILEDEGFKVEIAGDGQEALDRARANKPSLVLLDMALPIIDGYGVAAGLRQIYGDNIAILTVTAAGHAEEKAQRVGAIGYVSKPFELDTLINAVKFAIDS